MKTILSVLFLFLMTSLTSQNVHGHFGNDLTLLNLGNNSFELNYNENTLWPDKIHGIYFQKADTLILLDTLRHNKCITIRKTFYYIAKDKLIFNSQLIENQINYYQCIRGREMANIKIDKDNWGDLVPK